MVEDTSGGAESMEQEEQKLDCQVTVSDSGPWKKKVSVTIPRKEIDKHLDDKYGDMSRTAEVPGFRKGRAPRRLIEKRFGDDISDQTKMLLLAEALEQVEAEQDFEVLGEPDFDPEAIELPEEGDMTFEYEVEVRPEFELPKLEGIEVEKQIFEITDERVDQALQELRERHGDMENLEEGTVQEGDLMSADVTMQAEGLEEPQEQQGMALRVGPMMVMGVMVEDLGEELKGKEVGDALQVKATVPEDHAQEAIRGKEATFDLKLKLIRRLKPAELNEEFFEQLGVEDEDELREVVEDNLERQADREIRNMMKQQVYEYLDKEIQFELPEGVKSRYAHRMLVQRYYELMQRGVPENRIAENLEQLKAQSGQEAERQLKMSFVMDKVADELGVAVADPEVNSAVAQMAMMYGRRPERMRDELLKEGRLEDLRRQIRDEKAIDKILEMANVVDAKENKVEEAAKETGGSDSPKKKASKKGSKKKAEEDS